MDFSTNEGILIEKFGALEARKKGRDIFDIWFLLSKERPARRRGKKIGKKIIKNIESFPQPLLEKDLGMFLPKIQRQIIPNLKKEISQVLFIPIQ